MVEEGSPSGGGPKTVRCAIDCPCKRCGLLYLLPSVAGFVFPALGEVLTQLQWRLLLNNYSVPDYVYRSLPSKGCRWGGTIKLGRIFKLNAQSEDDDGIEVPQEELMAWVKQKRQERKEGQQIRVR